MKHLLMASLFLSLFIVFHMLSAKIGEDFVNISPFVALFFCGAAFWNKSKALLPLGVVAWIVAMPIAAHVQGFSSSASSILVPLIALAGAAGIGKLCANRSILTLMGGAFGSCVLFHLVTNLWSFFTSSLYMKNGMGLAQALWTTPTGSSIPTSLFFRNLCIGTLLFTALFIVATRLPYFKKAGQPALHPSPARN